MRGWLLPLGLGVVAGVAGYYAALAATPGVLMHIAEGRISAVSGYNLMDHAERTTAAARRVVRPSPDLAYSACPYDVSKSPVLVEVPPIPAAYWSLSVFDAQTDTAFVRNNIQSGGQAVRIAIALKGAKVPAGYTPVTVDGARGIALVRVLAPDAASFAAIDKPRRAATCRPA